MGEKRFYDVYNTRKGKLPCPLKKRAAMPAKAVQSGSLFVFAHFYESAASAAMFSLRSVMASPLLAKHMEVNGAPLAAWGHTPVV